MWLFVFCFPIVSILGSNVDETDLDLLGLLDDVPTVPTVTPTDWCSWFDDADLRIRGLGISTTGDLSRLEMYSVPLEVARRVWSTRASKDEKLSPDALSVVKRIFHKTWLWFRDQDVPENHFERFLYEGLIGLRSAFDADMTNAIVREYARSLMTHRTRFQERIAAEQVERAELIEQVRANSESIQTSLHERIDVFEKAQELAKSHLDRMNTILERGSQVRRVVEDILEESKAVIDVSGETQTTFQMHCLRLVKRIVFSGTGDIATELTLGLKEFAHTHNLRFLGIIYPVLLQVVDGFRRYMTKYYHSDRERLGKELRHNQRVIDETRGALRELAVYTA